MEIRDFALQVLTAEDLDVKLALPPVAVAELTDAAPGAAVRERVPGRPADLRIRGRVKVPAIDGMADPAQRPRILHGLANHELQAAELFAWALLAFPNAPPPFRRGLAAILVEEQRHTRMYRACLAADGAELGDYPVHGYFWSKVETFGSPLDFICAMSLTFENANLDHTVDYAAAARRARDEKTAGVIDQVHKDEVEHVRFGWRWLQLLKGEGESAWQAYERSLTWPLRPARARGRSFDREGRVAAGLDAEFIRRIEESRA
ncbi:MAG TPA: DUF455 family protein [Thermoanaerobaculia bacterium]|jgi:uncharacterized ferritin-like protein (DUF455 family)|nr:DUF455 family protein [Thermoanaerobaculia bacterium]